MSVQLLPPAADTVHYPDSDGKPIGETPRHIQNMFYSFYPLQRWFADDEMVFVAANMFVYYVKGDRYKHVSPDIFVVKGVAKVQTPEWRKYLVWQHGKGPDVAIEFTSESTREEDLVDKKQLYQDILKVQEYFLFDPWDEYLVPRLQGFTLVGGLYQPIAPIDGCLPSQVLGLNLEAEGELLRFIDPKTGQYLPIPSELEVSQQQAQVRQQQAEARQLQAQAKQQQAEAKQRQAEAKQQQAEAEVDRLRRQIEEMKKHIPPHENS